MPVRYTSKHHSDEDPGGLIRDVLDMGAEFTGPAQDVLLSWFLRLGDGVDAAAAARALLQRYDLADGEIPEGACGELVSLLRQTAEAGPERLAAPRRRRRPTRT